MIKVLRWGVLLTLVGCGLWGTDKVQPKKARHPKGARSGQVHAAPMPSPAASAHGNEAPRLVMLAVMDTVRADHTSLCGYNRPTTPTLDKLATKASARTCHAYSPAPWTHPSHASMFTGKPVTEHGAMWVSDSEIAINPVTRVRPLHDAFTTLAEAYKARGYQTIAVSANMILTPPTGLLQGFDVTTLTPSSVGMRGKKFRARFGETMAAIDPTRPVFLFVNFYDAHDPYPAVPAGLGWNVAQPRLDLGATDRTETAPYFRYVKGLSEEAEYAPFLTSIVNGYDWGIHEADENLGFVIDTLAKAGWLQDARVAITSDHGELLGEHRALRHGGYLYEQAVNVPLVYLDTSATTAVTLPDPFSTMYLYDLLLKGDLPAGDVVSVTERNDQDIQGGTTGGALWTGLRQKLQCVDGKRARFDLAHDPDEESALEVGADPGAAALDKLCAGVERLKGLPRPTGEDAGLMEALRAVGYVE